MDPNIDWVQKEVSRVFDQANVGDTVEQYLSRDRVKVASDGLSTDYYLFPPHATELRHLISYKDMSFARGNIFKACYRLGEKEGVDTLYDIHKIIFFANELKEMVERGERI